MQKQRQTRIAGLSIDLSKYDRRPRLSKEELTALRPFSIYKGRTADVHWSPNSCPVLARLVQPLLDVLDITEMSRSKRRQNCRRRKVVRRLLREMYQRRRSFWSWSSNAWVELIGTTEKRGHLYNPRNFRLSIMCVAYVLGGFTDFRLTGRFPSHRLCVRVFGEDAVGKVIQRVDEQLLRWGYGKTTLWAANAALCEILILNRSPRLEDLTLEFLLDLRARVIKDRGKGKGYEITALGVKIYLISRLLASFGIVSSPIPEEINVNKKYVDVATIGMASEWMSWCKRWRATSVLQPGARKSVYYGILGAGRWLYHEHPEITSPAQWTRGIAAEYVAAVDRAMVGQWTSGISRHTNKGKPLKPRTKDNYIRHARTFLRDCQEWEWIPRRFDPNTALSTPRSIANLIGPDPRVIDEDVWVRLLEAGLNLTAEDLPNQCFGSGVRTTRRTYWYPLEMVQALSIVWLFSGLRSDEIVRLRVGCVRWQREELVIPGTNDTLPKDSVCMLEVPVNKTSLAYAKPMDLIVGEAIQNWQRVRPETPLMLDRKTGEMVQYLFAHRVRRIGKPYINRFIIPLLCRKAGVPETDMRGQITSHRGRATIATYLVNAEKPMTIQEVKAWLGHKKIESTMNYVGTPEAKLAHAYKEADYYAQSLRKLETLVDMKAGAGDSTAAGPISISDLLKTREGLLLLRQDLTLKEGQLEAVDDCIDAIEAVCSNLKR